MSKMLVSSLIAALCGLTACGGGGDGGSGICAAIANSGSTTIATASLGGSVTNEARAFDGNLESAAALAPSATMIGGGTIRGTLGSGEIAGGAVAGVLLAGYGGSQSVQVTISTYQDGAMVEASMAGTQNGTSQVCPGTCQSKGGDVFFGITTTRPFDAIAAQIQLFGGSNVISVKELCKK